MWNFLNQGNANILFSYLGDKPEFKDKAVRVSKIGRTDLESAVSFYNTLVSHFLGDEFRVDMEIIELDSIELKELQREMSKYTECKLVSNRVLMMPNLLYDDAISLEIKPKWATRYSSSFKCRYCLHQIEKLKLGLIERKSLYCPLKLFSDDPKKTAEAIDNLFNDPQNNLAIFQKGLPKDPKDFMHLKKDLVQILRDKVIEPLKHAQMLFDPFGVDCMSKTFQEYFKDDFNEREICTIPFSGKIEDREDAERYLNSYLTAMALRDCSLFVIFRPSDTIFFQVSILCPTAQKPYEQLYPMNKYAGRRVLQFNVFKNRIFDEISNPNKYLGVQCTGLPKFNSIIKGLRMGELSIFTGPTGSGKTTFLSQLSLDYCVKNIPTLWGSFEIPPSRLLKKMMTQYNAKPILAEEFDQVANDFSKVPMHILDFFGSTYINELLPELDYSVQELGVRHIVIDNMQFMLSGQAGRIDKYQLQDDVLSAFRHFATSRQVHVTLVMHPRKEATDDVKLGMSSIYGSVKATQEADNVFILQRLNGDLRSLQVKKNRFDGHVGTVELMFDRDSEQLYETAE